MNIINYEKKDCLLQKSELEFYYALRKAIIMSGDIIIAPQVHLERIIEMHCEPHGSHCQNYFYHGISELSFDFVLFNKSFSPLLAIELDGKSHEDKKRKERDAFVDEICKSAKLPLLHWNRAEKYDIVSLEKKITEMMNSIK
jgi:hypothetical protein